MGGSQSKTRDTSPHDDYRTIRKMRSTAFSTQLSLAHTIRKAPSTLHLSSSSSLLNVNGDKVVQHHLNIRDDDRRHPAQNHQAESDRVLPLAFGSNPESDSLRLLSDDALAEYHVFLKTYPEYKLTWMLDNLRKSDYSRLDPCSSEGETYVDYMGAALYPESLVRVHSEFLSRAVMGNTHSISNSSRLSSSLLEEARASVLSFFQAPPTYTVIFTANASAALKLVGESFPFTSGSSFVLGTDSHNSVHGIREYASRKDASVYYIPSTDVGGFDLATAKGMLYRNRPVQATLVPSLFALTGQSNITNFKPPLSMLVYASCLGYYTLLDAAALAPTSVFSLADCPVDAMAISFYKMFGYPTGVGALIVKKSFLEILNRPWFSGGNVDIVQVPGTIFTRAKRIEEKFEDGTVNYLTLPAVINGLQLLSGYIPFLPLRLTCLLQYLISSLERTQHENGTPVVRILSKKPYKRVRAVGEQSDSGFMLSFLFLLPSGQAMPLSFIEYVAHKQNISLRTGCMCNSGGAAALLGIQEAMKRLYCGISLRDLEKALGRELGVVRISLGLASSFRDTWKIVRFAQSLANEKWRDHQWVSWLEDSGTIGQAL